MFNVERHRVLDDFVEELLPFRPVHTARPPFFLVLQSPINICLGTSADLDGTVIDGESGRAESR